MLEKKDIMAQWHGIDTVFRALMVFFTRGSHYSLQ